MAKFAVVLERKQTFTVQVEAATADAAMQQVLHALAQDAGTLLSRTAQWTDVPNSHQISDVVLLPPADLTGLPWDPVLDICDICGRVITMGINDVFLESSTPQLVCNDCYEADRAGVRTKWEGGLC